ncbi:MAG TPA: uracil-DNA glycosylase [Anaerolineae bacterium]|nr:uracil-DNA glycosylase [Anaerolineae bacterium]HNU05148.1 uracil-DNA glycosylase [Anaerolineae bacterium]
MSELEQLAAQIRACQRCRLAQTRGQAVPGEGPANAPILLIGEGPGFHEDRQGRPFVGRSGDLLEKLLASIGLRRGDVFIANVVKCRPPENRDPLPDEIEACRPYLDRQTALIGPRLVLTLGRISLARYFPGQSITRIHGQIRWVDHVGYVPMFHPAAALRNPQWMAAMRADFAQLAPLVAELYPGRSGEPLASASGEAQQMSLL